MLIVKKVDFNKTSDIEFANILKQYASERKGDIADLTNEAANRIFSLLSKIHSFREEDDLK